MIIKQFQETVLAAEEALDAKTIEEVVLIERVVQSWWTDLNTAEKLAVWLISRRGE